MSKVTCVGVDEMSIRKGHCYASVFADQPPGHGDQQFRGREGITPDQQFAERVEYEGEGSKHSFRKCLFEACESAGV